MQDAGSSKNLDYGIDGDNEDENLADPIRGHGFQASHRTVLVDHRGNEVRLGEAFRKMAEDRVNALSTELGIDYGPAPEILLMHELTS